MRITSISTSICNLLRQVPGIPFVSNVPPVLLSMTMAAGDYVQLLLLFVMQLLLLFVMYVDLEGLGSQSQRMNVQRIPPHICVHMRSCILEGGALPSCRGLTLTPTLSTDAGVDVAITRTPFATPLILTTLSGHPEVKAHCSCITYLQEFEHHDNSFFVAYCRSSRPKDRLHWMTDDTLS